MKKIYSYLSELGKTKAISLLWVICFCCPSIVCGDDVNEAAPSFKDRIAVKTNMVDWLLVAPNVAFDYDVVSTPYDKKSIGFGIKYNWNTTHTYIPKRVYNFLDFRLDYRFHWRQQPYDERMDNWEVGWLESAKGWDKLKAKMDCFRGSDNPKTHISIYVGPYASLSTFAIKLSADDNSLGRRGVAAGAGLTAGIALPLYGYPNGTALDLEFGGSLGWHFATYDLFAADVENNRYQDQGHVNKFIYYPFVSDLRVSLVYRFKSIRKQHTEIDYDLLDRRWVDHQMALDRNVTREYNIDLREEKNALEKKNAEIRKYKTTVEAAPDFDSTYCLAYLQPYVNMKDAPRSFTRRDKDTIAKIHIDSIGDITDPLLVALRTYIDTIPGIKGSDIDYIFVSQYNKLSGDNSKSKMNRTALIREIYYSLNTDYINNSNKGLGAGVLAMEAHSLKVNKHDSRTQRREVTDINYVDSIRKVTMTENERTEWLNNFKMKAWADKKKRMNGDYGNRRVAPAADVDTIKITSTVSDSLQMDSLQMDSLRMDSLQVDSLQMDSVVLDSVSVDSVLSTPVDSVLLDSVKVSNASSDSIALHADSLNITAANVRIQMGKSDSIGMMVEVVRKERFSIDVLSCKNDCLALDERKYFFR